MNEDYIQFINNIPKNAKVINIGTGNRLHEEYKDKFNYTTCDLVERPGIDIVADCCDLPCEDEEYDVVLAIALLEHVHRPWLAMKEFYRILKPGGKLFVNACWGQARHKDNHTADYWRFSDQGMNVLAEDAGFIIEHIKSIKWDKYDFIVDGVKQNNPSHYNLILKK